MIQDYTTLQTTKYRELYYYHCHSSELKHTHSNNTNNTNNNNYRSNLKQSKTSLICNSLWDEILSITGTFTWW